MASGPNTRERSKVRLKDRAFLDPAQTLAKEDSRELNGYKTLVEFSQGHGHNSILSFCLIV